MHPEAMTWIPYLTGMLHGLLLKGDRYQRPIAAIEPYTPSGFVVVLAASSPDAKPLRLEVKVREAD